MATIKLRKEVNYEGLRFVDWLLWCSYYDQGSGDLGGRNFFGKVWIV
jgi:hypothetical protein